MWHTKNLFWCYKHMSPADELDTSGVVETLPPPLSLPFKWPDQFTSTSHPAGTSHIPTAYSEVLLGSCKGSNSTSSSVLILGVTFFLFIHKQLANKILNLFPFYLLPNKRSFFSSYIMYLKIGSDLSPYFTIIFIFREFWRMPPTPDQNPGGALAPPSAFSLLVFFVNGKKVKNQSGTIFFRCDPVLGWGGVPGPSLHPADLPEDPAEAVRHQAWLWGGRSV